MVSMMEDVAKRPFVLVGVVSFVLLVPLATTSSSWMRNKLGIWWFRIHSLSYVAAALIGERDVRFQGERHPAHVVLNALGMTPLRLAPKEGLAVMNGTAVMTALACLAWSL